MKTPRASTIVVFAAWSLALINLIPVLWSGYYGYLTFSILCGIADGMCLNETFSYVCEVKRVKIDDINFT